MREVKPITVPAHPVPFCISRRGAGEPVPSEWSRAVAASKFQFNALFQSSRTLRRQVVEAS